MLSLPNPSFHRACAKVVQAGEIQTLCGMYLPNRECFHELSDGRNFFGLCDNRKISVWLGLDGKKIEDYGTDKILRFRESDLPKY